MNSKVVIQDQLQWALIGQASRERLISEADEELGSVYISG